MIKELKENWVRYLTILFIGMILGNVIYYFQYKDAMVEAYCYGRYGDVGVLVGSDYSMEQCYRLFAPNQPDYQILKWNWFERKWEEVPYRLDSTKIPNLIPNLEATRDSSHD